MKVLGIKLQKAGLIMVSMVGVILGMSGCEDRFGAPLPSNGDGKTVEVSLCVGLADEEDAASSGSGSSSTKSVGDSGFGVSLVSAGGTKVVTVPEDPLATAKPDKLYGLEVWQYDQGGNFQKGASLGDVTIGSSITVTLTAMKDCQLLIIARGHNGSDYTVCTLKDRSLSFVQDTTALASAIEGITTEDGIKAMPYILHLPHVNVTDDGRIESPEGTDIRILLRRLATRLTVAWENLPDVTGYELKQVLLQSIPVKYKLLPDNKDSYPSLLDQYKTISVSNISDKSQYSCWIPAVVRGESASATSDYYRTKANAPRGSAYVTFISQHKTDGKKKLNYRVYLGSGSSKDFSLRDNTNYIYKVTMNHASLPVDDKRVTIIDPIPASVNNNNLVPTANCFMVVPGGAFCFNPYSYYINGASSDNTVLQGSDWCNVTNVKINTPIKSVKVLWQTLEDGDLGDPVLGVVNTYDPGTEADDHTNIVDLEKGDDLTNARIYCRVAPNTTGGSGAIAAYSGENGTGDILWSWHIWVTDYNPDPLGNTDVSTPVEKRKQKYVKSDLPDQLPMMDRNLGAMAGYTEVPATELERSKANGFHYQWGRKDPFRSSYSSKKIPSIPAPSIDKPIEGLMSLYKGDGVTFFPMETKTTRTSYRDAYKAPYNMYKPSSSSVKRWYNGNHSDAEYAYSWGQDRDKGLHDPCPAGWRVCSHINYRPLFSSTTSFNGYINCQNSGKQDLVNDGGAVIYYDKANEKTSYFRFAGYWIYGDEFGDIGLKSYLWCREKIDSDEGRGGYHLLLTLRPDDSNYFLNEIIASGWEQEALLVRCIQERAN